MELAKISHDCPSLDKRAICFLLSRFFLTSSRRELLRGRPVPSLAIVAPAPSWPQAGRLHELLACPDCERRPCPGREPEHALRPCLSSSSSVAATCRDAAGIGGAHDAAQPGGALPRHAPRPLRALGHLLLLTLSPSPPRGRG